MSHDPPPGAARWAAPAWEPVAAPRVAEGTASAPGRRTGTFVLALVAVAGVLAGAVAATFLVTAAFISAAEDIGRGMSEGLGVEFGRSVGAGFAESREGAIPEGSDPGIDAGIGSGRGEQLEPVSPTDLGPAPPLSDYERYGSTCGGRVQEDTVLACAELD